MADARNMACILSYHIFTLRSYSPFWIIYPLVFMIIVSIAALSHKYFERYFLTLKDRFFNSGNYKVKEEISALQDFTFRKSSDHSNETNTFIPNLTQPASIII